jgi:hypothetical protein
MVFLCFTFLYRSIWLLRTLITFGIAQCGFPESITKVIAIGERTKDWTNRECQNKYSRTVKRKVKCLKSLEKEPKSSLRKNYQRIQDQVIRKVQNISKYPRVFLSMQNQLEVECVVLDTCIFSCIMRRLLCMQIQVLP